MSRFLITGATGRIGKEVVSRLGKVKDVTVRVGLRGGDAHPKADWLRKLGAHEVVAFDLTDESTWSSALDGVTAIYSASLDSLIQQHLQFCKKLNPSYIKHIVRISCFGAETNTALYDPNIHASVSGAAIPLMLQHYWWSEDACIKSNIPTTSIRANFFMNHLLKNEQERIKNEGVFSVPLGSCKNSFVCTNDVAEAAAVCLIEGPEKHGNKFYDITGPQSQSMYDVAAVLSKVMKKTITYEPQDIDQFKKDFGSTRAEFFEYLRNGFYTRCSPDFYNLTGRRPTTYEEYLTTKGQAGETGFEELFQAGIFKKGEDKFANLADVKRD